VVSVHDLNRDEVGIPILIKITHDNEYNGAPNIKGDEKVRQNEVSNTIWCWKRRAKVQYNDINSPIYICLDQKGQVYIIIVVDLGT
jgi:hypothetical protein